MSGGNRQWIDEEHKPELPIGGGDSDDIGQVGADRMVDMLDNIRLLVETVDIKNLDVDLISLVSFFSFDFTFLWRWMCIICMLHCLFCAFYVKFS